MANELGLRGWRRVVYWLVNDPIGLWVWHVGGLLLVFSPAFFFGAWWLVALLIVVFSFLAGWAAARRHWRKNGFVPKL